VTVTIGVHTFPSDDPVRPDWAIFESPRSQIFRQKEAKYLTSFWAILKSVTLLVKPAVDTFWANFGKVGLLFSSTTRYLVTLIGSRTPSKLTQRKIPFYLTIQFLPDA